MNFIAVLNALPPFMNLVEPGEFPVLLGTPDEIIESVERIRAEEQYNYMAGECFVVAQNDQGMIEVRQYVRSGAFLIRLVEFRLMPEFSEHCKLCGNSGMRISGYHTVDQVEIYVEPDFDYCFCVHGRRAKQAERDQYMRGLPCGEQDARLSF